jgi:hypothetical protein
MRPRRAYSHKVLVFDNRHPTEDVIGRHPAVHLPEVIADKHAAGFNFQDQVQKVIALPPDEATSPGLRSVIVAGSSETSWPLSIRPRIDPPCARMRAICPCCSRETAVLRETIFRSPDLATRSG